MTNEELITNYLETGDESALQELFENIKPITLHEAEIYTGQMTTYDMDDLLQEGNLVAWETIVKGNFKGGKFANYYTSAVRFRFRKIYRDYMLKNLVCISKSEDFYGETSSVLVVSDYAKRYREKHREECKRWYEKKKASQPPKAPKPKRTPEEKRERAKAYQAEYYAAHPEKLEERRAKARAYEKAKRERLKAERLAASL